MKYQQQKSVLTLKLIAACYHTGARISAHNFQHFDFLMQHAVIKGCGYMPICNHKKCNCKDIRNGKFHYTSKHGK